MKTVLLKRNQILDKDIVEKSGIEFFQFINVGFNKNSMNQNNTLPERVLKVISKLNHCIQYPTKVFS